MNPSTRRVLGLVSVWAAAVVVVAGAQAPAPAAPQREKSEAELLFERLQQGERVMNATCSSSGCHTIRPIQTSAKDAPTWTATLADAAHKGIPLDEADRPLLLEYLARFHGPLPDGDGKEILLTICTMCHDLQRVRTHGGSVEDWFDLLNAMIGEGAPLTDPQIPVLLRYLATNFPPHN